MPGFAQKQKHPQSSHLVGARRERVMPRPIHAENSLLAKQQAIGNQAMQRFAESCPLALPSPNLCPFGGVCHTCPARNKNGDVHKIKSFLTDTES